MFGMSEKFRPVLAVLAMGMAGLPLVGFAQSGQTIQVANGDAPGLITAIQTLNANGGGTIDLASGGTYSVTAPSDWWYGPNAFPAIASTITIDGNGATISRAAGSPKFRFFYVSGGFSTLPAGNLTLSDLTLIGGLAQGGSGGSGIEGGGGGAGMGGAIYNQGSLNLLDVALQSNSAQGGGGGGGNPQYGSGGGGGGGLGGNGGSSPGFQQGGGGGGGLQNGGGNGNILNGGGGGGFVGSEGAGSCSGAGQSSYGGNGGNSGGVNIQAGGGGGGFTVGENGGDSSQGTFHHVPGTGAIGGGTGGGDLGSYNTRCGGGGGAFGGGGSGGSYVGGGGGGGVGGGGGGAAGGGSGGFGGGGGGGYAPAGQGGFGAGGAGAYANCCVGGSVFAGGSGTTHATLDNGGGGAGLGGAIFNHQGTASIVSSAFTTNSAVGGSGGGTADGFGGALFNLNGTATLTNVTYSGNTVTDSAGTADVGAVVYNLSHDGGDTVAGQTSRALLVLVGTAISTTNGDLFNNQVNGTAAVITLSNLTQTYTGNPLMPAVSTVPSGLAIVWSGTPQTNAGSYTVIAAINDPVYTGTAIATFVIQPATATVTLSNLTQTYTGSPLTPTAATVPAGLKTIWSGAPQTNAGSYTAIASVNDPNYVGSASATFVIQPAVATVVLSNLTQTYTGSQLTPAVATVPAGLQIVLTGVPQTNAGSYPITATIQSANYQGSASATFTVSPAPANFSISGTYTFNGSAQTPTVTSPVAGLTFSITGAAKTQAGSYPVTVTPANPNYARATVTFVINPYPVNLIVHAFPTATTTPTACANTTDPCLQYGDQVIYGLQVRPGTFAGVNTLASTSCGAGTTSQCVNITITGPGGFSQSVLDPVSGDSTQLQGRTTNSPLAINGTPGTYQIVATPLAANPNFIFNAPTIHEVVVQRPAYLTYTGLTDFTVSSSSNTESLIFTYTVQDPSALAATNPIYDPLPGVIANAQIGLTLTATYPGFPFTGNCAPQFVTPTSAGTATLTCTMPNVPVNRTYVLRTTAGPGSYYTPSAGATSVTITDGNNGAGSVTADGYQTATYLDMEDESAGKYKPGGLIVPTAGTKVTFKLNSRYGTDPTAALMGKASVVVTSKCLRHIPGYLPRRGENNVCVYKIESGTIQNLSLYPAPPSPSYATFSSTATIFDVTDGKAFALVRNVDLQMQMSFASGAANKNTIAIQAVDKEHGLWFSNNWTGQKTGFSTSAPTLQSGTLTLNPQ